MTVVLFREDRDNHEEFEVCQKYFKTVRQRTECRNEVVIGRYSCLPYYQELELDLSYNGSCLLNSYKQHRWIADFEWYAALKDFTPRTWTDTDFYLCEDPGPFVIKGRTNSRKFSWNSKMFATNKQAAVEIGAELATDPLIGPQGIVYRKYVPLKTFEVGVNGLPFTNEWRLFFYRNHLLSAGYYWSIAEKTDYKIPRECVEFGLKLAGICQKYATFYVLDIAEKEDGEWILIEINDAQQSGLSCNNPHVLYRELKNHLG